VFGFRTTIGTIPSEGAEQWISKMSVSGPMARNVSDLGLILSVMNFTLASKINLPVRNGKADLMD
jgi:Asp-tRNA(Asn)/Glu-tRNA(Gln) amidotransferase A subunit family amidase